jgi:hypothetical protein
VLRLGGLGLAGQTRVCVCVCVRVCVCVCVCGLLLVGSCTHAVPQHTGVAAVTETTQVFRPLSCTLTVKRQQGCVCHGRL